MRTLPRTSVPPSWRRLLPNPPTPTTFHVAFSTIVVSTALMSLLVVLLLERTSDGLTANTRVDTASSAPMLEPGSTPQRVPAALHSRGPELSALLVVTP